MRNPSHNLSRWWRVLPLLAVLLLIALAAGPGVSQAEGAPYKALSGYDPIEGCFDVTVGSVGMDVSGAGTISLNVPGPVKDAWLVWTGTADLPSADPTKSDITVNGTPIQGVSHDQLLPLGYRELWYMYYANMGPQGYNLVSQGANTLNLAGWGLLPPTLGSNRNGASLVVVYDTSPCGRANAIYLFDEMDWAFWRDSRLEFATGVIPFVFDPANGPRTARIYASLAGIDNDQIEHNRCRGIRYWFKQGSGAVPATLHEQAWPESVGVNGGFAIGDDLWSPQPPCTPVLRAPGTALEGGYLYGGGEYGQIMYKVPVPAGDTYVAYQLESEVPEDPNAVPDFGGGESFVWVGPASPFVIDIPSPDLEVTKDDGVTAVELEDTLTYTINYANTGDGDAEAVVLSDTLPNYVTFVSASNGGAYSAGVVTWNLGKVVAGGTGSVTLTVKVKGYDDFPGPGNYTLVNNVSISTPTPGDDPSNNTDTDTDTLFIGEPELTISKSDGVTIANPGDTLTYTINYANTGDGKAKSVVLTDTLPQYTTFVSATGGGVHNAGVVTWNLGIVEAGASGSVSVTVAVDTLFPAAGTYSLLNSAAITTPTPGDDPSNNSATDTDTLEAAPTLDVTKTAAPDPVPAGDQVTYTIGWSVGGSAPAVDLTLTDAIPADTTFVSASDGGVFSAGVVTWNLGTQNPGASGSVTLIVETATPLENNLEIPNTANLAEKGPLALTDSASAAVKIVSSHTIGIDKSASPEPVEAGDLLTYTINYTVEGNSPSGLVTITDPLPANTTFVSASNGGVFSAGVVTWNLGDLLPRAGGVTSASGSVTLVVRVATPLPNQTLIDNTATIDDSDPSVPPVSDSVRTTVHSDHRLTLDKTAAPSPVEKGALLTYTLTWGVTGNEPAPNVVLRDVIPFGTTFVSATGGGVFNPPQVEWNLGNINPPANGVVTFVVRVHPTLPNGIDIDNTAILSDDDPGTPPVDDSVRTPVIPTAFGSIGDDVFVDADNDGQRDPGEAGIPGVTVKLSRPGPDGVCGTADDVAVATTVTNGDGKYLFPNLTPGVYCVTVDETTVPAGLVLGGSFDNPNGPITVGDNQDRRDIDFGYRPSGSQALIGDTVYLDANKNGVQDPGEVGIGGVTVMLKEPGADGVCGTADDVTVTSTTTNAAGNYQFAVAPGTYCVMVDETTVPAGLTLSGGVNPHGPIVVNAGDSYLDADFGYSDGPFGSVGDLVFFDANRNGVYDPAAGEGGIANVTIDLFKAGADGVCGTGDDQYAGSTTTDANGNYQFTGLMDGTYCVVVTDTNGVLSDYIQTFGAPDTNNNGQASPYKVVISGANNVVTADFGFADGHILSLLKSDSPDPVDAGGLLVYSITYSVFGREAAPNVVLKDTLPPHVTFVSATNGGTESGGVVTWNLGTLPAGTVGTVQITVRVATPLVNGTILRNLIEISDDDGLKVTDIEDTRVRSAYTLTITKTDAPDPVIAGQELVFTLAYAVEGNAPATDVKIVDAVPAGTTFVSATGGGVESGGVVTWNLGNLNPPASGSVQMTVRTAQNLPTGTVINNTATITGKEGPKDDDSSTTNVQGIPLLQLRKSASTAGPVVLGQTYTYSVCYQNVGGDAALNVVVVDDLPKNVDYVMGTASAGGVYDATNHRLTWTIGTVAPGPETCLTFDAKVTTTFPELMANSGEVLPYRVWADLTLLNKATLTSSNHATLTAEHRLPLSSLVDVRIYKAVDKSKVIATEEIEYTLTVANEGNAPASNVVVTDPLSMYLEEVRVTTSQGTAAYDAATHTVTVSLGVLPNGASATIKIKARVKYLQPDQVPLTFPNSAVVSFTENNPRESNIVRVEVDGTPPPNEIPEPGTIFLLGSGLAGLAGWARRRRQQ